MGGEPGGSNNPYGRVGKPEEIINTNNVSIDSPATIPMMPTPAPPRDRSNDAPRGNSVSYALRLGSRCTTITNIVGNSGSITHELTSDRVFCFRGGKDGESKCIEIITNIVGNNLFFRFSSHAIRVSDISRLGSLKTNHVRFLDRENHRIRRIKYDVVTLNPRMLIAPCWISDISRLSSPPPPQRLVDQPADCPTGQS